MFRLTRVYSYIWDRIIPRARNTNLQRYLSGSSRGRAAIMRIWLSSSAAKVIQKASSKNLLQLPDSYGKARCSMSHIRRTRIASMYMHYARHRIKRTVPLMDMTVHFSMYGIRIYP